MMNTQLAEASADRLDISGMTCGKPIDPRC